MTTTSNNVSTETKKIAPGPIKSENNKIIKAENTSIKSELKTEKLKNEETVKADETKTTVKKTEPKKTTKRASTTTKKKDIEKIEKNTYIEFNGKQIDMNEMYERAGKLYKEIKPEAKIENLKLYVNIAESKIYFVVNGITEDNFKFEI